MKSGTLLTFILAAGFSLASAQDRQQAFAITGQVNGNFNWTDIRGIDMATGNARQLYFENGKSKFSFKDAETKKNVEQFTVSGAPAQLPVPNGIIGASKVTVSNITPTSLRSAAMAYDKRNDKLFFASMHTGKLMWLDLRSGAETPAFYTIEKNLVNNEDYTNEAFNITRMTIGADGNGYALSNDGKHFIRFTTGKKTIVSNMGSLLDAENNNIVSIHNQCSSWGGDMVADAFGNYICSPHFKIFLK